MDNSIPYYEWITEQNNKLLLVVPHSLQEELMQESHDKITAGHLGAHKMLIRLRGISFSVEWARPVSYMSKHVTLVLSRRNYKQNRKQPCVIIMLGILWIGFILIYLGRSPSVIMGIVTF